MEIVYVQEALNDVAYWKKSGNKKILIKITSLLQDIEKNPFEGIGKPELLKFEHSGKWSRRINKEHRIIYQFIEERIFVLSLRGHYTK